jgi:hypothetical protein
MKQENGCGQEVKQHVKQTSETRDETCNEMSNRTCKKKMKNALDLTCYICGTLRIVTLAPVELLHFSEGKQHPRHHRPQ